VEESISLEEFLKKEDIQIDKLNLENNDVVVIARNRLSDEDVQIVKELRISHKKKVEVYEQKSVKFKDFRGGEYVLAFFLIKTFVLPVISGMVSALITKKILDWRKKKEKNSSVDEPEFKVDFYVTDKGKKWSFSGKADDVIKGLNELSDKND